jgi:hypothetical protein
MMAPLETSDDAEAATNIAPPTVLDELDNVRLEAILEATDLAGSYSRSASEAAWRGDRRELGAHLDRLRLTVIHAREIFKELGREGPSI